MKYKGILLDIDGTIYDYEEAHHAALTCALQDISQELSIKLEKLEELYDEAKQDTHALLGETASSHNKLIYFQKICESLNLNSLKFSLRFYNLYWDKFIGNMHFFEGVYDFLNFAKELKICLLSDLTVQTQLVKIDKLKIFEFAHYLVTSEEAGREKPDQNIFLLGLKKLGLRLNEVCMIGDNFQKDIKGATSLGIKSFWFNPKGYPGKVDNLVTEFSDFFELKSLLL